MHMSAQMRLLTHIVVIHATPVCALQCTAATSAVPAHSPDTTRAGHQDAATGQAVLIRFQPGGGV